MKKMLAICVLLLGVLGCWLEENTKARNDQTERIRATNESNKSTAFKTKMAPAQLALGDPVVNSVGMLLVPIPAGEFQMGSLESDLDGSLQSMFADRRNDEEQHLVKISKPFYLAVHEVTQQQYEKVMGARPWKGQSDKDGPDYPATYVSWNDAVEFCRKLTLKEGTQYRLPTEAEWEYACRAGTTTIFSFGDDVTKLGKYAWYYESSKAAGKNYGPRVGQKLPNTWGLYDMHGNVWEWCQDWYGPYGKEKTFTDPMGPANGKDRVLRGGSWPFGSGLVRSAARFNKEPSIRNYYYGFRVARVFSK